MIIYAKHTKDKNIKRALRYIHFSFYTSVIEILGNSIENP